MASILAFAGSNSSTSINYELVKYSGSLIKNHELELMDMSRLSLPIYSEDLEKTDGFPDNLKMFLDKINKSDGLIISVNEHNSGLSAFFKNVLDWLSRLERKFLLDKKIFLMATSPGGRGGIGALQMAEAMLPRFGAEIVATFSLPSFYNNFEAEITDVEQKTSHQKAINQFLAKI